MTFESQNIEWKQSWSDDYLKWICGFANAQGGRIFIGKDDAGKTVGVPDADREELTISYNEIIKSLHEDDVNAE